MLDKQAFRETYHFLDKEVIIEIIDIFLSEYETKLQKLEQNLADGDLPGIRFTAHNIKGVVSNFNVSELYQVRFISLSFSLFIGRLVCSPR